MKFPPSYSPLFYRTSGFFVRPLMKWFFSMRIEYPERIPPEGPVIVCANHVSYADPIIVGTAVPRTVRFMMSREYYEKKFTGLICGLWGAFPVGTERITGGTLRTAQEVLDAGYVLGIFPEGGRSQNGLLKEGKGGAALIALRQRVPIVPAAIIGTYEAYPAHQRFPRHHPVTIRFGEPILFHEEYTYPRDKKSLPVMTGRLMEAIRGLLEVTEGD